MEEYVGKPRMRVAIKITGFGKRWLAWDGRLKKDRHWYEGKALCWVEYDEEKEEEEKSS